MPENPPVRVSVVGLEAKAILSDSLETSLSMTFAPAWFRDALHEAETDGRDGRRREIVFAVACVESYLFEWVRGIVNHNADTLEKYFPFDASKRVGIRRRWGRVIGRLRSDRVITMTRDPSSAAWNDFEQLVDFRDGVLHAAASRPDVSNAPPEKKPVPAAEDFHNLRRGRAAEIARNLILDLHDSAGTPAPDWLKAAGSRNEASSRSDSPSTP